MPETEAARDLECTSGHKPSSPFGCTNKGVPCRHDLDKLPNCVESIRQGWLATFQGSAVVVSCSRILRLWDELIEVSTGRPFCSHGGSVCHPDQDPRLRWPPSQPTSQHQHFRLSFTHDHYVHRFGSQLKRYHQLPGVNRRTSGASLQKCSGWPPQCGVGPQEGGCRQAYETISVWRVFRQLGFVSL